MPNRDSYLEGTPSWADVATNDVAGGMFSIIALAEQPA